jgi:hypothetical protein
VLADTARRYSIVLDDEIIRRMIRACRLNDPRAAEDEIAYMLDVKIQQLRSSRTIENMPAVLVKAIASLFPSNELQRLRAHKALEIEKSRELAQQVLADPDSTDKDRDWARNVLTDAKQQP